MKIPIWLKCSLIIIGMALALMFIRITSSENLAMFVMIIIMFFTGYYAELITKGYKK